MRNKILGFFQAETAKGYGLAISAAVAFGLGTTLTKAGSFYFPGIDFFNIAIWGWGFAILLVSLVYLPQAKARQAIHNISTTHRGLALKLIVLGWLNSAGWFYAITVVEGGIVSLLDLSLIVWSFLIGALFLRERFSWRELPGICLAMLGIVFISSLQSSAALPGVIALVLANLSLAVQSLIMRSYPERVDTIALTYVRAWGLWLGFAIPIIMLGLVRFDWSIGFLVLVGLGQVLGLFVGRGCYITAHRYLPISRLSLVLLLIPVVTMIGTKLLINEPITTGKVIGAALILGGLAWFIVEGKKSKAAKIDL